jgi:hypothetical protein
MTFSSAIHREDCRNEERPGGPPLPEVNRDDARAAP